MQHANKQKSGKPRPRQYSIRDSSVMNHELESLVEICRNLITVIMAKPDRATFTELFVNDYASV